MMTDFLVDYKLSLLIMWVLNMYVYNVYIYIEHPQQ